MTVNSSLHVFVRVCGTAAIVVGTAPLPILAHILPPRYGAYHQLLPWAAVTGFSLGGINLVTTYWQATGRTRRAGWTLLAACAIAGVSDTLAVRGGNAEHLAWSAAITSAVCLMALLLLVRADSPGACAGGCGRRWRYSFPGRRCCSSEGACSAGLSWPSSASACPPCAACTYSGSAWRARSARESCTLPLRPAPPGRGWRLAAHR